MSDQGENQKDAMQMTQAEIVKHYEVCQRHHASLADQRLRNYNFFFIIFAASVASMGSVIKASSEGSKFIFSAKYVGIVDGDVCSDGLWVLIVSIAMILTTMLFVILECRTYYLLSRTQDVLISLEQRLSMGSFALFQHELSERRKLIESFCNSKSDVGLIKRLHVVRYHVSIVMFYAGLIFLYISLIVYVLFGSFVAFLFVPVPFVCCLVKYRKVFVCSIGKVFAYTPVKFEL